MEENNLVPINPIEPYFPREEYGITVEKSNRRQRKRRKKPRKLLFLLLLACLSFTFIKNFSFIKAFVVDAFLTEKDKNPIKSEELIDIQETPTNTESDSLGTSQNTQNIFGFINTSPTKTEILHSMGANFNVDEIYFSLPKTSSLYQEYGNTAPIVLIVCSSPLEGFSKENSYTYTTSFYSNEKNVQAIAEKVCNQLNELGINTLFLRCEHTSGTLYENKQKYESDIRKALIEHPSISYVFDISRSLTINDDMSMYKEAVSTNGISLPTVRLTCGTQNNTLTEIQKKSIFTSNVLTNKINQAIPFLVSQQVFSSYELNSDLSVPYIKACIGSFANTFEESLQTASVFASQIAEFLSN